MLLPTAPGTCPECGVAHDPSQPHNQRSLAYQYWFYNEHGRWPTWADALAHCDPDVRILWAAVLAERGIQVDGEGSQP